MRTLAGFVVASVVASGAALPAVAAPIIYTASLSGPAESPPNASPGTGNTTVTVDPVANTLRVQVSFSGLQGTTTASHIHCCTAVPGAGTAIVATTTPTFAGFPLGVTSGSYDSGSLDLLSTTSYNPAFITANGGTTASAEAVLLAGLAADTSYLNIHTSAFPMGEIRGFLVPRVPEPASLTILAAGLVGLAAHRRRAPRR